MQALSHSTIGNTLPVDVQVLNLNSTCIYEKFQLIISLIEIKTILTHFGHSSDNYC